MVANESEALIQGIQSVSGSHIPVLSCHCARHERILVQIPAVEKVRSASALLQMYNYIGELTAIINYSQFVSEQAIQR